MNRQLKCKVRELLARAKESSKEKGICYCIRSGIRKIRNWAILTIEQYLYKTIKSGTFTFQGKTYSYFYHSYNRTWRNERAVEVPVIWEIVKQHCGKRILEVGNVLSHYFVIDHDVLDKYEKADGVINQDVVDFHPHKKYDLIVSISTLEHVGWDESPKEPYKILRAIDNLKNLLASNGKIFATIPAGYNVELDELLRSKKISFTEMYCLKRTSPNNRWIETDWNGVCQVKYDRTIPSANAIVILVFR